MFQFGFAPLNAVPAALTDWETGMPKKEYYLLGISPAEVQELVDFKICAVDSNWSGPAFITRKR